MIQNKRQGAYAIARMLITGGLLMAGMVAAISWFAYPLQATDQQSESFALTELSASASDAVTHTVKVINDEFVADVITITVGDTVEWVRMEGFHNVVSDGLFRLGEADGSAGTTWESVRFTFTEAGTYDYYCEPHQFIGMVGQVIVVDAEPVATETPVPVETPTPTLTATATLTTVPVITETPEVTVTRDVTPTPGITLTPIMTETPVTTTPEVTPVMTTTVMPTATGTTTTTPTAISTVPTVPPIETPTAVSTVPTVPPITDPMTDTNDITGTVAYTGIVISEVYFHGAENSQGSFDNDWVELQNMGEETIDISSWFLCARRSYSAISDLAILFGDLELAPGEIVVLGAWTDWQVESDLALYLDDDGDPPPYSNADFMVDFVQWGSPINQGRANVAAEKGIWPQDEDDAYDFIPVPPVGQSIALIDGRSGLQASDYTGGITTGGQSNSVRQYLFLPFISPEE